MHTRNTGTRCLTLLVLLTLAVGSNVEPLVGQLRDGTVHHESAAAAAAHRSAAPSEHGHEDGSGTSPQHQHGSQHQHGTSADHCTHAHGLALPTTLAVTFAAIVVNLENIDTVAHPVRYRRHHSPPPKA